jgi:hypothetical protein
VNRIQQFIRLLSSKQHNDDTRLTFLKDQNSNDTR